MTEADKKDKIGEIFRAKGQEPDPAIINRMAKIAREVYYPAGATIQDMGMEQNYLYLVIEGIARSYYIDGNGNDVTKMFIREGEFAIGESLFLPESLEVFEALENLKGLRFEAKTFKELICTDKAMIMTYVEMLEQTVIYKMRREYSLQNMRARERYVRFCEMYGDMEGRVSQSVIASYLGIKKESLSRIRRGLKRDHEI